MRFTFVRNTAVMVGVSVVLLLLIGCYDLRFSMFGVPYDWKEISQSGVLRAAVLVRDTSFERNIRYFAHSKGLRCECKFYESEEQTWVALLTGKADVMEGSGKGYSWTVRENCDALRDTLNAWYDVNIRRISKYDNYFKFYGDSIGMDWKLLAAIGYVESRFKPNVVAPGGTSGIMQLAGGTAAKFGTPRSQLLNPEKNIRAAARLLSYLDKKFSSVEDPEMRRYFIIASYNSGSGLVDRARARAAAKNEDVNDWFVVEKYYGSSHSKKYTRKILAKWKEFEYHK